jgi:hypothetical protein
VKTRSVVRRLSFDAASSSCGSRGSTAIAASLWIPGARETSTLTPPSGRVFRIVRTVKW